MKQTFLYPSHNQVGRLKRLLAQNNIANPNEHLEGVPMIYIITPTHTRPLQKAELTRYQIFPSQKIFLKFAYHYSALC